MVVHCHVVLIVEDWCLFKSQAWIYATNRSKADQFCHLFDLSVTSIQHEQQFVGGAGHQLHHLLPLRRQRGQLARHLNLRRRHRGSEDSGRPAPR
jgi:hypothetical protein